MKHRERFLIAASIWLLVLGSLIPRDSVAEPPILRAGLESEPLSLDWNFARAPMDRFIVSFLMRGLLKYDSGNRPVCDLCSAFTVSKDGKTYDFELHPDQEWSDGEKLEAKHFVDSFQRLLDPANPSVVAAEYSSISGARPGTGGARRDLKKLGVTAESKTHLRIRLDEPSATFTHSLTRIASYPIRLEAAAKARKDAGVSMASGPVLGPYQLAAWERGKRIVIEGNPRFKGERPVYRVDFILGRHVDLLAKLKRGLVDILPNPTTEDIVALPGRKVQVNPYWATRSLVFNARKGPAANASFRRAVLYALDRAKLPSVLKNGERAATGVIPPGLPGHRDLPLVTQDLARAKAEKARLPARSVPFTVIRREGAAAERLGSWLAAQLKGIGIETRVRELSAGAYADAWASGSFDAALQIWAYDIAFPAEALQAFRTDSPANRGGWTHVAFDALLSQMERAGPYADPRAQLDEMTRILEAQEAAIIPLGYPTQAFLLGKRVMSFATTPFGDPDLVRIKLRTAR